MADQHPNCNYTAAAIDGVLFCNKCHWTESPTEAFQRMRDALRDIHDILGKAYGVGQTHPDAYEAVVIAQKALGWV